MSCSMWLLTCLLLSLSVGTLQKGVPSRGNGRAGPVLLPPLMRGVQAPRALNGFKPGVGAGIPVGALGNGLKPGKGPGYGVGVSAYRPAIQNGYVNGQAGRQLGFRRGKAGKAAGFLPQVGRVPVAQRPVIANGYLTENGYGIGYPNGALNGYGGLRPYANGALLQAGVGGKVPGLAGFGAGIIPGAGPIPGLRTAVGYGNGYPSFPMNGAGYGLKPGKAVAPGFPYNGQQLRPPGAGMMPFDLSQQKGLPDAAAVKYGAGDLGNGFLGTGLAQGLPADAYGQVGLGPDAAQLAALKEGPYPLNGYYGNGYNGCPSGKCGPIGKK